MNYLVDDTARDVSRLTGVPWSYQKIYQKGTLRPCIMLGELDDWDVWRIVWAQIGGHFYMDSICNPGEK